MSRFKTQIYFLILSLCLRVPATSFAQPSNLGLPFISGYSKADYGAATQNWDASQDQSGVMYFANNDGLLSFNGRSWSVYPLPNRTIVRSVLVGPDHQIYVGGQDELGIFAPDDHGRLRFQSLKQQLPDDFRSFEDVWDLALKGDTLWMRTSQQICFISPSGSGGFRPKGEFGFMQLADDGQAYAFDSNVGVMTWNGRHWALIPETAVLSGQIVTGMISRGDSLWIATARHGIHIHTGSRLSAFPDPVQSFLVTNRIHAITSLSNGQVAIGTSLAGVLILSSANDPIAWINKRAGLQHNYVLSLFEDRDHNLWAGLNNGIDYLEICSPYRRLLSPPGEESAGYAFTQAQGHWWLGTGTGLYTIPFTSYYNPIAGPGDRPTLVPGSAGQVWGLSELGDHLLVGHHEGSFDVTPQLSKISSIQGFWNYVPVPGYPDLVVAGNYEGIYLLRKTNGSYTVWKKVPGLEESSRMLAADGQRVWMAHPYRGVFAIDFSQGLEDIRIKKYGQESGLPDDHFNHVFKVFDRVLFGTIAGVYEFDPASQQFREEQTYQQALGKTGWVKSMKEDPQGNVWFIMEEGAGRLVIDDQGLTRTITCEWLPELRDRLVKGHEFLYPFDQHHVFFGVDEGFIRYDPSLDHCQASAQPSVVFSGIWLLGESDSLVFGSGLHQTANTKIPTFDNDLNTFRFSVASTEFQQANPHEFRFYLEGLEPGWLAWGDNADKEYAQLPPGTYVFHAQSRDAHGQLTEPLSFAFEIFPPWYASRTANIIYGIIGLGVLLGILLVPQRRFQEEREKLQTDLIKTEEARQKEVSALRTQSLSAEIQHKNQELATATMHLVQKNETLNRIRGDLDKLMKEVSENQARTRIRSLLRMLNEDERLDKDWEQFAHHFDQVHSDFLRRLQEEFPQLTPKDHRLCAYLRMNLSSKEIAPMMNISVRGVEISRYRLRKKLGLDHDENLNEFMLKY